MVDKSELKVYLELQCLKLSDTVYLVDYEGVQPFRIILHDDFLERYNYANSEAINYDDLYFQNGKLKYHQIVTKTLL